MGCPKLTYQEENGENFFQGLWKKSASDFFRYDYYPFGLQTATSWTRENTTTNNFLYNGGTELNTTTGVMDLFYRNYDPVLGRMNQVDPMASKLPSLTPYNYSGNSPVVYNDPKGDLFNGKAFCGWCDRGAGNVGGYDPMAGRIMDGGTAGGGIGLYSNSNSSYLSLSRSDRNFFLSSYNTLMNSPFAQASFAVGQNGVNYGYNLLLNVTGQVIFAARDNNVTLASNGGWLVSNSTTVSDYGSGVSFTTGAQQQASQTGVDNKSSAEYGIGAQLSAGLGLTKGTELSVGGWSGGPGSRGQLFFSIGTARKTVYLNAGGSAQIELLRSRSGPIDISGSGKSWSVGAGPASGAYSQGFDSNGNVSTDVVGIGVGGGFPISVGLGVETKTWTIDYLTPFLITPLLKF